MDIPRVPVCPVLWVLSNAQDNKVTQIKNTVSQFSTSEKSIIERTASYESHSTLMSVLKATNLDKVLDYNGEFTVFAPSNLAFEKLSKITIDKLNGPKNKKALRDILSYHIIADKLSASTILKAMCRGNGTAKFILYKGTR